MNHWYRFLLLLAWMIVIFLLSNEVAGTSSGRSDTIVSVLTNSLDVSLSEDILTFLTRKAAHIVAYFILGILIYNVLRAYKITIRRTILLSIIFALTYAVSDELHQTLVPGRSGELRDVLIDTTASTIGIYAYYFIHKKRLNRIKSKNTV